MRQWEAELAIIDRFVDLLPMAERLTSSGGDRYSFQDKLRRRARHERLAYRWTMPLRCSDELLRLGIPTGRRLWRPTWELEVRQSALTQIAAGVTQPEGELRKFLERAAELPETALQPTSGCVFMGRPAGGNPSLQEREDSTPLQPTGRAG